MKSPHEKVRTNQSALSSLVERGSDKPCCNTEIQGIVDTPHNKPAQLSCGLAQGFYPHFDALYAGTYTLPMQAFSRVSVAKGHKRLCKSLQGQEDQILLESAKKLCSHLSSIWKIERQAVKVLQRNPLQQQKYLTASQVLRVVLRFLRLNHPLN